MSKSRLSSSQVNQEDEFSLIESATNALTLEEEEYATHSSTSSPVKEVSGQITGAFIGESFTSQERYIHMHTHTHVQTYT